MERGSFSVMFTDSFILAWSRIVAGK